MESGMRHNLNTLNLTISLFKEVIPKYNGLFKTHLNELDECVSPVHYHFAMIYKHKGEVNRAKEEFEKAIKAGGPQNIFAQWSKHEIEIIYKEK
jgi:hypothetical protein